jgi:lactate permease
MMIFFLDLALILTAAMPLLVVLYLMIARQWTSSWAGIAGWATAVLLALLLFGANGQLLLVALGKALLLALFVLYIIWSALLFYHVINEAGAIAVIGEELPGIAPDQASQALLLGWIFGAFLQGVSGYGVPVAVVAPLLAGLGFAANTAVLIALLGHGWAVTFGSLGASFFALIAAGGWPGAALVGPAVLLLGICCFLSGLAVLWVAGKGAAVRRSWFRLLILTLFMAGTQAAVAAAGFWSMAALMAGLLGLALALLDFRFSLFAGRRKGSHEKRPIAINGRRLARAFWPYFLLTLIIVSGQTAFRAPLSALQLNLEFPAVVTRSGWQTAAEAGQAIAPFGHAGALLLYSSLLSFAWYRWRGTFRPQSAYSGQRIWRQTVKGALPSTISIIALLAMSLTMQHAGMTDRLAQALSQGTGRLFPLLTPFIGVLGAFMTGSNTNSNVVFGLLQQQTAVALNLSVPFILAGQTAGGAIGSLLAPAKVVVGCSTVSGANEGQILKQVTGYGLGITAVISVLVWLLA